MAQFNLDGFIGANKDLARGYTFYINVQNYNVQGETQKYLVRSSSLPTSTVTPAETNWQGNVYKLGTTQEFADFTVTYSVDINDDIRKNYEDWLKNIHNPETNLHGPPAEYMADIQLEHVSHRDGSVIMTYNLVLAWPTVVGEMALDYSSKDLATFEVTFAYQYHTFA